MKKLLILGVALVFSGTAFAATNTVVKQIDEHDAYRYKTNRYGVMTYRAVEPCNTHACIKKKGELYRKFNRSWRINLDFDSVEDEFKH